MLVWKRSGYNIPVSQLSVVARARRILAICLNVANADESSGNSTEVQGASTAKNDLIVELTALVLLFNLFVFYNHNVYIFFTCS